jgi:hypothetical protein
VAVWSQRTPATRNAQQPLVARPSKVIPTGSKEEKIFAKSESFREIIPSGSPCAGLPTAGWEHAIRQLLLQPGTVGPRRTSSTIQMVEARNLDIKWLEPRYLAFDGMSFIPDDSERPSIVFGRKTRARCAHLVEWNSFRSTLVAGVSPH